MLAPVLAKWHKDYAAKGLAIVAVCDGTKDSFDKLKKWAASQKTPYLVFWDEGRKHFGDYSVSMWTTSYLLGVNGKVIWDGCGKSIAGEAEKAIKEEVKRVDEIDLKKWNDVRPK